MTRLYVRTCLKQSTGIQYFDSFLCVLLLGLTPWQSRTCRRVVNRTQNTDIGYFDSFFPLFFLLLSSWDWPHSGRERTKTFLNWTQIYFDRFFSSSGTDLMVKFNRYVKQTTCNKLNSMQLYVGLTSRRRRTYDSVLKQTTCKVLTAFSGINFMTQAKVVTYSGSVVWVWDWPHDKGGRTTVY